MPLQPVTDPNVIQQLDAAPATQPTMQPVTDPNVIAQLEAQPAQTQPQTLMQKLGQTWPVRMAKDIYSAAQLPGDVYAGNTQVDVNNPDFMKRVTTLGSIAPVGTLPTVISIAPSVKQLVQTGGKQISDAVGSGLPFASQDVQSTINTIRSELPNPRVAEDTHAAVNALEAKAQSGVPITFADIKNTRDELLDVQSNAARSTSRTAATDLRAATIAKHSLDDLVSGTPEGDQFIAGNANVTGGKQAEGLDKRLYRSELRSAAANSGMNVGNTVRSNVASMLLSKDARGLSPEATQQAQNLVYGSVPENFMRHWGNVLGGGGGLGQAAAMAGTGFGGYIMSGGNPTLTGLAASAAPIAGTLLKMGANRAALNHLDALSMALRSNTPLGQIVNRGNFTGGMMPSVTAAKAALARALMAGGGQQPPQQVQQ